MESLTIFFPLHVLPTEKHISTILIKNLKKSLEKKIKSNFIFFIYNHINIEKQSGDDILLDLTQFSNAIDVLKNINPDIVFLNEDRSSIDLSFHIACDFLKIPVICPINHMWLTNYTVSKKTNFSKFKFLIHLLFASNKKISNNSSSRTKINFLLKTMKNSNFSYLQIIKILMKLFFSQLTTSPMIYSKSVNTLFRLETELSVPILLKNKFSESNLIVTGNPIYDDVFKRVKSFKHIKNKEKLSILFAPSQVFEDGIWNELDSDNSFTDILKILSKNKDKFSIYVKIHPTSVEIIHYKKLLNSIDPTIQIFQKEDFLDLLEPCDVVIGYSANSTMLRTTLIAKKPIILCNFYNNSSCELLEKKLAVECKSPDKLISVIFDTLKNNPSMSDNANNFLMNYYYKQDGLASDRLADAIISFLKKKN